VGSLPVPGKGCQLCHQNDDGGKRTATTPFARHLVDSYGLEPGAPAPLRAILEQNRKNGDDSDDDGDSDYDEIVICSTDPNDPSVNCAPPPTGSAGAVGTGGMPASGGAASGGVSAENGGATPDGSGGMSPAGGGSEEVATGGRRSLAPQPPSAKYGCTLTGLPRDRSGGLGPALLVALAFARSLRRPRHGSASPRASRGSQ
jgi:hypothetical protein